MKWFWYASPQTFYPLAAKLARACGVAAAVLAAAGLYVGLFVAPTDAQQGEAYRIIFIHVPAAWMSMFIYVVMAFWAGLGLALNTRLSGMMAAALAPTGALFTFIALWTGALWGRPTWGTLLGVGRRAPDVGADPALPLLRLHGAARVDRGSAPRRPSRRALALVGVVNIPIIYYSVKWWNTLHQGASVSVTAAPKMAATMLAGMLVMALAFWMYSIAATLLRVRGIIRERGAS
jgi:heme exporter protein C